MFPLYFYGLLAITIPMSFGESASTGRNKRQVGVCVFKDHRYRSGEQWTFAVLGKTFSCTCNNGTPSCSWSNSKVSRRCYDRSVRRYRTTNDEWERQVNGKTLDCRCEQNERSRRMQMVCSGQNRCHHNGASYRRGDDWQSSDITGLIMDCQCLGAEKISCRASVTTEVPQPEANAQWVEDHIVYGQQVLRPKIATLQACDTGTKVVSSGYTWNQTSEVGANSVTVDHCVCRDALIMCTPYTVTRRREPHCVTEDGAIRLVGETWIRTHNSHDNLRWRCECRAHGDRRCSDIGYCVDPHPPPNGAMLCVAEGKAGTKQTLYCKPMCAVGYDFVNTNRYYRIWEVCNHVTSHRWSGGFAEDALMLGRCRRREPTSTRRGRRFLYLPTNDCRGLNSEQIQEMKFEFIQLLQQNNLCQSKCQTKFFKCGIRG